MESVLSIVNKMKTGSGVTGIMPALTVRMPNFSLGEMENPSRISPEWKSNEVFWTEAAEAKKSDMVEWGLFDNILKEKFRFNFFSQ
jgi:hypothetical protein